MSVTSAAQSAAQQARTNMIEGQLRPNKVTDPALLEAVSVIPREDFVPDEIKAIAYVDEAIPLGNARSMMEPMILIRLIQALEIKAGETVMDIGGGTGYAAAILARLAGSVVVVEEIPALSYIATAQLKKLEAGNASVFTGPLAAGLPKQAPYDAILIEGGVNNVPEAMLAQLSENGRLVAVEMSKGPVGLAKLWQKTGGIVSERPLFDAGVALLPGFATKAGFVF